MKKAVVTGGGGFIGAYLVKKLVKESWDVTVVDTLLRGEKSRLSDVEKDIRLKTVDVRNEEALIPIFKNKDVVFHLAAINGTDNFYNYPELVLDVGIRGMLSVVEACKKVGVVDLVIASSAEVYQHANIIPTPETIELKLPNSVNPRYSYGGSKIISELIAFNYGREHFHKMQVFRPHNIYGPDMGWKHVVPQLLMRGFSLLSKKERQFLIQGNGTETRAFCFVDDAVDGIILMYKEGKHREIYHIGNEHEISILDLVKIIEKTLETTFEIITTEEAKGGTKRRCPDIRKIKNLGYLPKVAIEEGISLSAQWYKEHINSMPINKLL